ncbi:hypothetical protein ILYODFUR_002822 [Ilyodon furcidens]|uniref:Secreted protein n=1 Tax=Ilyodon furcidens TaxID=33524 RepID=A0ABV0TSM9_9TELE
MPSLLLLFPSLFLPVFLLHHSMLPEDKPAFFFIRPSHCLFLFPLLFFPLLSFAFQPPFVVKRRRGVPKHKRRPNVNAGVCVEAHIVAVVLSRHQSVDVSTLMFSCVDQTVAVKRNQRDTKQSVLWQENKYL